MSNFTITLQMVKLRKEITLIPTNKLIAYDKNNKKHPEEQISLLVQNINKFGFTTPLLIDKENVIIAGHGRLEAAKRLNLEKLPCILIDDLTENEIKSLRIADNRLAELGETDWLNLKEEYFDILDTGTGLEYLTGYDKEDFNFDELLNDSKEVKEDEFEPPEDVEEVKTDIKQGDIIQLGNHRLMCGDSTNKDDVDKLMDGNKADLGHNDPPYGMKKENEGVLNDNLNYNDLLEFNKKWINLQFTYLKDNGSFYCWGTDEPLMDIYSEILKPLIKTQKATFRNLITWNKGNGQGQLAEEFRMYPIADEKCLFVMCGVQGFNNNADNYFQKWDSIVNYLDNEKNKAKFTIKDCKRLAGHSEKSGCHWFDKSQWMMPTKETYDSWRNYCLENNINAFEKEYDELKKEYDELKKEYYSTRAYFNNTHDNMNNVWHIDRTSNQEREGVDKHATPKPLKLCSRVINSSCKEKGLVIDVFGGSGSTLIACEQLNRVCYMMELDARYCNVIVNRFHKLNPAAEIKCLNRDLDIERELQ